jgi:fumarate reductase flavoprotein subunit
VSINGANRLGSNSLTELLVFGARASHAAAEIRVIGEEATSRPSSHRRRTSSVAWTTASSAGEGGRGDSSLRVEMQKTMEGARASPHR